MGCIMPGLTVYHQFLVYSNSSPLSQWCHPTISSSVIPFSSCLQSFPALGSFPMSQFFASGGQSVGVSASASVFPMNIQDWFPSGWTGWISLMSKGLGSLHFLPRLLWKMCHRGWAARLLLTPEGWAAGKGGSGGANKTGELWKEVAKGKKSTVLSFCSCLDWIYSFTVSVSLSFLFPFYNSLKILHYS